jgi:hypothetical protein
VIRYAISSAVSGYLRVLDLEHGRVSFVTPSPESTFRERDPNPRGGTRGARGVSAHGDRIVVANAERLFVFDTSWRLVAELSDRLMSDVHDVLADERGIWVAATGGDMLLLITWDGKVEHAWSLRGERELLRELGFARALPRLAREIDFRDPKSRAAYERLHLNGIGRGENGLLVSLGRVVREVEPRHCLSAIVEVDEANGDLRARVIHLVPDTTAPNHNVAEDGDLLVYNDTNRHGVVVFDRRAQSEVCCVPVPGEPAWVRGLARVGPGLWLVGSQAPLAVYLVDVDRAEVVAEYPLGGIQEETVYGIAALPDAFADPRQPLGSDPYEFWKRASAAPAVTPIGRPAS